MNLSKLLFLTVLLLPLNVNAFCFNEAGAAYNVPPLMLWSISKVESGFNPYAVNKNQNGSYDYCHMQINSGWYKWLAKHYGKEYADNFWQNLSDPCFCSKAGAWILAMCVKRYGETPDAVGCYNAGSKEKMRAYSNKVTRVILKYRSS